jgi:hypothetical protein
MFFEHTQYISFTVVQNTFGCNPPTTVKLQDLPGSIVWVIASISNMFNADRSSKVKTAAPNAHVIKVFEKKKTNKKKSYIKSL